MGGSKWITFKLMNLVLRFLPIRWGGVYIGEGGTIDCPFKFEKGTCISDHFCAKGYGSIHIGKYCAIGADVKVITSDHDFALPSMNFLLQQRLLGKRYPSKVGSVKIGNDVWIGDNVIILAGVEIGSGAVIGAGSIVTHSIGDYEMHAGVPARFVKLRVGKELIGPMLKLAWWDWDANRLMENKDFFSRPISAESIGTIK
jgi:virginiamycin A acetyltransferase